MNDSTELAPRSATLTAHRDSLGVGARFHYVTYYAPFFNRNKELVTRLERGTRGSTWEVLRIEERGVVVGHPLNGQRGTPGGHQHLVEWTTELAFFALA